MKFIGPYSIDTIVTGDAKDLVKDLPDGSIDLIFTDPIYNKIDDYKWLAEVSARVLKPNGSVLAFCGNMWYNDAISVMLPYLNSCPPLIQYVTGATGRMFKYSLQLNVLMIAWLSKGKPKNDWMAVQQANPTRSERGHIWGKNDLMIAYRMEKFTNVGEIVLDPFVGGGVVPSVCKMLNRHYLGFEIDAEVADIARQKVLQTQLPLPIIIPKQTFIDIVDIK